MKSNTIEALQELIRDYKGKGATDTFIATKLITKGVSKNDALKLIRSTTRAMSPVVEVVESSYIAEGVKETVYEDNHHVYEFTNVQESQPVEQVSVEQAIEQSPHGAVADVDSSLTDVNPFDKLTTIVPYILGEREDNEIVIDGIKMPVALSYKRLPAVEITVVDNFMSAEECKALQDYALPKLRPSEVVDSFSGLNIPDPIRTSYGAMFAKAATELLATLEARAAKLIHLPLPHSEGFQVLRYDPGQNYDAHQDLFHISTPAGNALLDTPAGNRLCTLLIYLNDVQAGGGTNFPQLNITVAPKMGRALFFSYTQYTQEPETTHAGLPPIVGQKWVAVNWYRQGHFSK